MSELAALETTAREVGTLIGNALPEGVGFFLMMFDFGEGGWSTFLSNAERESMTKALLEHLEKIEYDPATKASTRQLIREWRGS